MSINVLFFGKLAEETGSNQCLIEDVRSFEELEQELYNRYPTLQEQHYLVAVNQELVSSQQPINPEDEVALLPPFAGG